MNKITILAMLFCLIACKSEKEGRQDEGRIKQFEMDLQKKFEGTGFVGLGIAVVKNDQVVYQAGFGHANVENKRKYTTETIQPIGSISKLFIGVALAKAIELGYFNLETDLDEILPFAIRNPHFPAQKINVHHLVTHTSGITDSDLFWSNCYFIADSTKTDLGTQYIKGIHLAREGDIPSLAELMSQYFKADEKWYGAENFIEAAPGAAYEYTNAGSSLAAYLIELKSGIPFDEFCQKHIFNPLKLKNTAWKTAKDEALAATLYLNKKTPLPRFQLSSYPDGSLHTTTTDLSIFLLEMMRGYQGESNLLNPPSFQLLFEKRLAATLQALPVNSNSGIFWDWSKNGRLGHNGADPGLFTILSFDPSTKTGNVMLLNLDLMGQEDRKGAFAQLKELRKVLMEFEAML